MKISCTLLAAVIIGCVFCSVDGQEQNRKHETWTKKSFVLNCHAKLRTQIKNMLGEPDDVFESGLVWRYTGMTIADPDSNKNFTTVRLTFSQKTKGVITDVEFRDAK